MCEETFEICKSSLMVACSFIYTFTTSDAVSTMNKNETNSQIAIFPAFPSARQCLAKFNCRWTVSIATMQAEEVNSAFQNWDDCYLSVNSVPKSCQDVGSTALATLRVTKIKPQPFKLGRLGFRRFDWHQLPPKLSKQKHQLQPCWQVGTDG